ncbi:hypothetical protein BV25DRAFT_1915295 [Artomyces pyxidatus]|uniref:Uncharacterized protein n=1 Tax=Artomyces pyxidatus TaxID=48021 RepID=A0ACB8T4Q6_9AGAM|nr:hypothetical protein BV25DRAFT_1915295 [Artomyces pyxidatus]
MAITRSANRPPAAAPPATVPPAPQNRRAGRVTAAAKSKANTVAADTHVQNNASEPNVPSPEDAKLAALLKKMTEWKVQLNACKYVASFVGEDQGLQAISYPADEHTRLRIPPAQLLDYKKGHDWPLPNCFCKMRDGIDHRVSLFVVHKQGKNYGDTCMACPHHFCRYFVNLRELLEREPNIPATVFPAIPGESVTETPITPSRRGDPLQQGTPTVQADKSNSSVAHQRNATPGPSGIDRSVSPSLPVDPLDFGADGATVDVFSADKKEESTEEDIWDEKGQFGQYLNVLPDEFNGRIDDIQRFWTPPPGDLAGTLERDVDPLPDDDANALVDCLKTSGIRFHELIRLLSKCKKCGRIMTPNRLEVHSDLCGTDLDPIDAKVEGVTNVGPVKEKVHEDVPGIGPPYTQRRSPAVAPRPPSLSPLPSTPPRLSPTPHNGDDDSDTVIIYPKRKAHPGDESNKKKKRKINLAPLPATITDIEGKGKGKEKLVEVVEVDAPKESDVEVVDVPRDSESEVEVESEVNAGMGSTLTHEVIDLTSDASDEEEAPWGPSGEKIFIDLTLDSDLEN